MVGKLGLREMNSPKATYTASCGPGFKNSSVRPCHALLLRRLRVPRKTQNLLVRMTRHTLAGVAQWLECVL